MPFSLVHVLWINFTFCRVKGTSRVGFWVPEALMYRNIIRFDQILISRLRVWPSSSDPRSFLTPHWTERVTVGCVQKSKTMAYPVHWAYQCKGDSGHQKGERIWRPKAFRADKFERFTKRVFVNHMLY
jgi:hypothetical protein